MTEFAAASSNRLLGPQPWLTEPRWDWSRDWARIAARAQDLVANDPFAAAMLACKLDNTHGPDGLRPVSLAQYDTAKPVTTDDHALRETLERSTALNAGVGFDAGGILSRKAFDRQLDWLATVLGEGFAVREWIPGRVRSPFATCWQLIRPERVSNPDGRPNDARLYHGIELDNRGQPAALWIETTRDGDFGTWSERTWTRVKWYANDGTPNVVHRVGWRLPGMLRGLSMFAPMLLLAKQLGGTIEAHVTAKRAQACNPVIYYVDDPAAAAAAARADAASVVGPHTRFNPLQVYYAKFGYKVEFAQTNFNGADLEAFLKIGFRVLCATWQLPIEVVLCQMGESSLASARAGLDQVDRTAQGWQDDHIEQASNTFEHGLATELLITDKITAGPSGISGLLLNRYRRPPKYSTDRKKDAETIAALIAAGASPTTALATAGLDYEDETDQAIRDELYKANARKSAGLDKPTETEPQADPDAAKEDAETTDGAEDPADDQANKSLAQALDRTLTALERLAAKPAAGPLKIARNKDGTLTVSDA
jgi:capsid protein